MLPFKFRTNKIQEIEFRNVFQNIDIKTKGNHSYFMEVSYEKPAHNLDEANSPEIVTFSSN